MRELARPVALAAAAIMVVVGFVVPIDASTFTKTFPVVASRYLEDVPTFHTDSTGGYLIYEGFDQVFIDDRAELFGPLYRRFVEAMSAQNGWKEVFDQYEIRQALLPTDNPLLTVLVAEGWGVKYRDEDFTVVEAPTDIG
jgi:hypothetical protein